MGKHTEESLLEQVKRSAEKMLLASDVGILHPEIAHEAAYRFGFYVDTRVADLLKAGKDPVALFEPGTPDYVLHPSLVATFMPTEAVIVGGRTGTSVPDTVGRGASLAASAPLPQRLPDESTTAYLTRIGVGYYR